MKERSSICFQSVDCPHVLTSTHSSQSQETKAIQKNTQNSKQIHVAGAKKKNLSNHDWFHFLLVEKVAYLINNKVQNAKTKQT